MKALTDDWIEYMVKNTDIPLIFLQSLRYMLLACTLGRFFFLYNTDEKIRPNLYITLASPAGLYYRSHAVDMFCIMLFSCLSCYNKALSIENKKELTSHSLPGGSAEGIVDHMEPIIDESLSPNTQSFLSVEHEMGMILKSMFGNSYLKSLVELYIKLYDGKQYHKVFSQRIATKCFRNIPKGTYFNLLGVMQDADHYLTKGMSTTGFVRRMIIAQTRSKGTEKKRAQLFKQDPLYPEIVFQAFADPIGKEMGSLYKITKGKNDLLPIRMNEDAIKKINKITDEYQMEGRKNPDNPYHLFLGTHGIKIGKLALLEAIDREGKSAKFIEVKDIEKAHQYLIRLNKNIKTILELSSLDREEKKTEKYIWQAKGVIYRYQLKHSTKSMPFEKFRSSFCGGYHCRNPMWTRVKKALEENEVDVKFERVGNKISYLGIEEDLIKHGINVSV